MSIEAGIELRLEFARDVEGRQPEYVSAFHGLPFWRSRRPTARVRQLNLLAQTLRAAPAVLD